MSKSFKHHPNEPGNPKRDIMEQITCEEALEQSKLHCSKHNKKRVQIAGEFVCSLCDEEGYEMLESREKLEKAAKHIRDIGQFDSRERKHPQADEMRIRPEEEPTIYSPITKLDYFAAHAPEIPEWYEGWREAEDKDDAHDPEFTWPWHWAELMLKARPKKPVSVSEEEVEGIAKGLASKLNKVPIPPCGEWESRQ